MSFSIYYQGFYDSFLFNNLTDSLIEYLDTDDRNETVLMDVIRHRDYTLDQIDDFPYAIVDSWIQELDTLNQTQVILQIKNGRSN